MSLTNKQMRMRLGIVTVSLVAFFVLLPNQGDAATTKTYTGTLAGLSGTAKPATLLLTVGSTTYTTNVTTSTSIVRRFGGASDLGEFMVSDSLQVTGTLSGTTLTATRIKDISVQRAGGTFKGTIVSLNCAAKTFAYKPDGRAQQTVVINSATKFTRGGAKGSCAGLKVGERAKVIGLWRQSAKQITADRVIVDVRTIAGTISDVTRTNGGLPATLVVHLSTGVDWTVNVTSNTKLYRKGMAGARITEFGVNDKVEVRGTVVTGKTLNAITLRNTSRSSIVSTAVLGKIALRKWDSSFHATTLTTSAIQSLAINGWPQRPIVKDGYVYIPGGPVGLEIVDARTPSKPTLVATVPTGGFAGYVNVVGSIAYVGSSADLYLVNIADPANASVVGTYTNTTPGGIKQVSVINGYAYITQASALIQIIDVRNPTAPTYVAQYLDYNGTDFWVNNFGTTVYLSSPGYGITKLDTTTPTAPTLVNTTTALVYPQEIAFNSNYGYLRTSKNLEIFDPATMATVGRVPVINKNQGWMTSYDVTDTRLYAVQTNDQCETSPAPHCNNDVAGYSLADPAAPTLITLIPSSVFGSAVGTNGWIREVTTDGTYVYVMREANVPPGGVVTGAAELFILRAQ